MSWKDNLRTTLDDVEIYDVEPSDAQARLHANERPFRWPLHVREALAEIVANTELNRYPDTSGRSLRRALGARFKCGPHRVVLGNGSDEIISILLTALGGASKPSLVIPTPTFVMYSHCAKVLGYEVRRAPLDDQFQLDPAAMRAALDGATVCFLARPNNPTSSLFDAQLIEQLVREFPDVIFVIDEAYIAYAPDQSLWDPHRPSNFVYMGTLSKVGLAAIRVGYAIVHPDLAPALNKVRHPYNVSATSLALAHAVLTKYSDVMDELVDKTIRNRGKLAQLLASIPGSEVFEAHANLVLCRLTPHDRATPLVAALFDRGVQVKDVSRQPGLEGCIRASVGTTHELGLLEEALSQLEHGGPDALP